MLKSLVCCGRWAWTQSSDGGRGRADRKYSEAPRILERKEEESVALGLIWTDKRYRKVEDGEQPRRPPSVQRNHQVSSWISTSRLICVDMARRMGWGHAHRSHQWGVISPKTQQVKGKGCREKIGKAPNEHQGSPPAPETVIQGIPQIIVTMIDRNTVTITHYGS